jgi:hypothetical protein
MKSTICTTLLITSSICSGQVGNLSQIPILLNPSLVGSAGVHRAGIVFGTSRCSWGYDPYEKREENSTKRNLSISYDLLSKRLGTGLGAFLSFSDIAKHRDNQIEDIKYKSLKSNYWSVGVAFAPKYSRKKESNVNKIKYTWSPSLSIGLDYNKTFIDNFEYTGIYFVAPPSNNTVHNTALRTNITLGGLFNSKMIMLGAMASYMSVITKVSSNFTYETVYYENDKIPRNYFKANVLAGYTFPTKEGSLLGGSIITRYGWGTKMGTISESEIRARFTDLYFALNLRIKSFLLGNCITSTDENHSRIFYIGYKAKSWKATTGITVYKDAETRKNVLNFGETTFSYTFK